MIRYINPPKPDEPLVASLATTTKDGLMSMTDKEKINNVIYSDDTLYINNLVSGGSIGPANTTVDIFKSIAINQTTSNQTLLLPNPTSTDNIINLLITNNGTTSFLFYDIALNINSSVIAIWNGQTWNILSSYSNISNFNIHVISTNYTIPSWNTLILVNATNTINITLPESDLNTQSQSVIISNVSGNVNIISDQLIYPFNTHLVNNVFNNTNQSIYLISLGSSSIITSCYNNNIFMGSSNTSDGKSGLVPIPLISDQAKYLKGDGSWATINSLPIVYLGLWNANTNIPILQNGIGQSGNYYHVSVAGNTNIDGISNWNIDDWIIFNGIKWDKINNSFIDSSAPGNTWKGNNTSITSSITNNQISNINEINSSVLNISSNKTVLNPVSIEVQRSNSIQSGYLHYQDWNTFNNKQNLISNYTQNNFTSINFNGQVQDSGLSYSMNSSISDDNVILSSKASQQSMRNILFNFIKPIGVWNANTNYPLLRHRTGTIGFVYYVSVAGTQTLPSNELTEYLVGDVIYYSKELKWLKFT